MDNERFLRLSDVMQMTSLSRSTIYKFSGEGRFPKPKAVTPHRSAWLLSEIQAWIRKTAEATEG